MAILSNPRDALPAAAVSYAPRVAQTAAAQREAATLSAWMQRGYLGQQLAESAHAASFLAQAALDTQGIAARGDVGYLPTRVADQSEPLVRRWAGRLIFRTASPHGDGFLGLSLADWRPDGDPCQYLAQVRRKGTPLLIHVGANGWFNFAAIDQATRLILVEEPLDVLTILSYVTIPRPYAVIGLCHVGVFANYLRQTVRELIPAFPPHAGFADFRQLYAPWRVTPYIDVPLPTWFGRHVQTYQDPDHGDHQMFLRLEQWLQERGPALLAPEFVCQDPAAHRHAWKFDLRQECDVCPACTSHRS